MTIDKVSFVAQQLRGMSDVQWIVSEIDRADELARILVRAGVTDLWALQLQPSQGLYHVPAWTEYLNQDTEVKHPAKDEIRDGYSFVYYGSQNIGFLGTPDKSEPEPLFRSSDVGYMLAWSATGHGNVTYVVRPNEKTKTLEIAPVWRSSSDAANVRGIIITAISFFVMAYLPMVGVSAGTAVGNAIVPASFAAAYPTATTVIGNIAISTALNGGDIKQATENAALSYVAGGAGDIAGGYAQLATDSEFIGLMANTATQTAILGGDIKQAVLTKAAFYGVDLMDNPTIDFFNNTGSAFGDSFGWTGEVDFGEGLDFGGSLDFTDPFLNPFVDLSIPDNGGNVFQFDTDTLTSGPAFDEFQFNPFLGEGGSAAIAAANSPATIPPPAPSNPPPPNSSVYSPAQLVQGITQATLSAISVIKAYRSLDAPTIQPTARQVRPDGSVSAIGSNGLIQTRTPSGQVTAARPPVGVPQATVDGNYIVNNGDGTYSVVSPTGQTARYSYASTSEGGFDFGNISPTMLAAGVGVLALILKGRK